MSDSTKGSTVVTLVSSVAERKESDIRLQEAMELLQKKEQQILELRERLKNIARVNEKRNLDRLSAFMVTGPSCTAYVISKCRIDVLVHVLCNTNGDRVDDYAVKKVNIVVEENT